MIRLTKKNVLNLMVMFALVTAMSVVSAQENGRLMSGTQPDEKQASADIDEILSFLPEKVGKIGNEMIGAEQIRPRLVRSLQFVIDNGANPTKDKVKKIASDFVDHLISRQFLKQWAKEKGYDPMYEKAAEDIAAKKERYGEKSFQKYLASEGWTEPGFKEYLAEEMAIKKWGQEHVASNITVTDEQVHEFYQNNRERFKVPERVEVSHILIKAPQNADKDTRRAKRAEAERILDKIKEGADFAEMAKKHSEDATGENGGRLPPFGHSEMLPSFENVAFSLEEGQLSDVVTTPYGYHIIKSHGRLEAGIAAFDEVKDVIKMKMEQRETAKKISEMLEKARQDNDAKVLITVENNEE